MATTNIAGIKDYSEPGYLCPRHIEELQTAAANPHQGLAYSPAYQVGLISDEEFQAFNPLLPEEYLPMCQLLACFTLLANDIPLEV
jgi:hypothetical protein